MHNDVTGEQKASKAASILGKLGGSKGGKAASANMTKAQRKERARRAVTARWEAWRAEHPEGAKPQTYTGKGEAALLQELRRAGTLEIVWDDRRRPTNKSRYNAAVKLVAQQKVRQVKRSKNANGGKITIART